MAVKLVASACSDKGCVRKNNEDSFCLNGHFLKREKMDEGGLFKYSATPYALFAVCDGMGGEEAGEEASLLAVSRCAESLKARENLFDREKLVYFLRAGCEAVYAQARERGNHSGATMALLIAAADRLRIANMGDSRIYRLSAGEMKQLTVDHTEIQRLYTQGKITREQMKTHPKRHMIYQYWGMPLDRAPFQPYISTSIPYVNRDRYLICSDGLTDMLTNEEIKSVLSAQAPVEQISEALVRNAKARGGRDNVTVVVIEVESDDEKTVDPNAKAKPKKKEVSIQTLYARRKKFRRLLALVGVVNLYLIAEWIEFFLR